MELITEFLFEIVFRRFIAGIFGYYTLFYTYKIFGIKKRLEWLEKTRSNEEEFGKGCFIGIVGLISFSVLFIALALLYHLIFMN